MKTDDLNLIELAMHEVLSRPTRLEERSFPTESNESKLNSDGVDQMLGKLVKKMSKRDVDLLLHRCWLSRDDTDVPFALGRELLRALQLRSNANHKEK